MRIYNKEQLDSLIAYALRHLQKANKISAIHFSEAFSIGLGFKSYLHAISAFPFDIKYHLRESVLMQERMTQQLNERFGLNDIDPEYITTVISLYRSELTLAASINPVFSNFNMHDFSSIGEIGDYYGGNALIFNDFGKMLVEHIREIEPDVYSTGCDVGFCIESFENLVRRNPANPYIKAVHISSVAPLLHQESWWLDTLDTKSLDVNPRLLKYRKHNAEMLYPYAKEAITFFEKEIGDKDKNWVDFKSVSGANEDAYFWPALLFYGAKIALNTGDEKSAKKWLDRYWRVMKQSSDSFGARFYLAICALNGLGGKVKTYYDKKHGESIGKLFFALESFAGNDYEKARKFFKEALNDTWVYIELFEGKIPNRSNFTIACNQDTPALSQEIDFFLAGYWKNNPEAKSFFSEVLREKELKKQLIEYHYCNTTERKSISHGNAKGRKAFAKKINDLRDNLGTKSVFMNYV